MLTPAYLPACLPHHTDRWSCVAWSKWACYQTGQSHGRI